MSTASEGAAATAASATYRRLLGYSARYWPVAVLAAIGMLFDAGCGSAFTLVIKPTLDDLFVAKDPTMIFWMPIIIVGLFLVRGAASYVADYGMAYIARGVVQTLRAEVFDKYLRLPTAFFSSEPPSHQIARMTY
ncbi:MAG TPA: ABC transporter transmembrane domain-containing protein, partial [Rhodanobacteraceae bacterium]|nr:ABC transporter transmembrane domain-containing protein [Rhodanobacteraceae bacterium]